MSLSCEPTMTMPVVPAYGSGGGNGNNDMWGGNNWIWIIVLFLFAGGWGRNQGDSASTLLPYLIANNGGGTGLGSPSGQGWATRADINEGFALNGLQTGQSGILSAITNGFHGVDNAVCNLGYNVQNGFNATQVAMMQGQNALQAQLAQCCCDQRAATQDLKYTISTEDCATRNLMQSNTRDLIENQNSNARAILDALTAQRIEAKDEKIAAQNQQIFQLQLAASQSNQNAVLMAAMDANKAELLRRTGAECPVPAYWVQPPTPVQPPCNPCNTCC